VATEVIMPALGVAQETGRVVRWNATEGQEVRAGDELLEIETDKVTVSIEAPTSGLLASVRAANGDDVPVGTVIAFIVEPGEEPPSLDREGGGQETATLSSATDGRTSEQGRHETRTETPGEDVAAAAGDRGRRPASPVARRRAREAGIDLNDVRGSGPGGAVTAADLDAAIADRDGSSAEVPAAPVPSALGEPVEVGAVWRRMAEHLAASWSSAPHFYLSREVDAGRLVAWREALGRDVTITDLLVWLSARALERHPEANAVWQGDGPRRIAEIGVGVAVAIDDGLVVPVLPRANELSVTEVAERRRDLVERARSGALRPEDVQGGSFTVTNLGMYGVDAFAAVVNGPQAAILAVGRIRDRVVAVDGRALVRPCLGLTLSCDHRVLDGARAARFLDTLARVIEEPLRLVR
jgi:pyruvate dehydrogenase E2 component (dihydrolipoamide acetyltransferase)